MGTGRDRPLPQWGVRRPEGDRIDFLRPGYCGPSYRRTGLREAVLDSAETSRRFASITGLWTNPSVVSSRRSCVTPGSSHPDPHGTPKRPRWPNCTKSCSQPVAHSGFRPSSGWRCCRLRVQARLIALKRELDELKKKPAHEIPRAVVVQDGGPAGTRHEGFKDAQVYLRGNPAKTRQDHTSRLPADPDRRESSPDHQGERPATTGRMAGATGPPPDGPRHGESDLAASLRRRSGPHFQ